jgi:hypothetical protein
VRRVPEIATVELRTPRAGHCFGSSDLDLRAATASTSTTGYFKVADALASVLLRSEPWLRIFGFDLCGAHELELERRLCTQSYDAGDDEWLRLLGDEPNPPTPGPEPEAAHLGRVTYDYADLSARIFEAPLDLHYTRLIYKKLLRIDHEARQRLPALDSTLPPGSESILRAAHGPANRGRVRRTSFDALARAHALALVEASALAEVAPRRRAEPSLAPVRDAAPPRTLETAVALCAPAVRQLCAGLGGTIESAILSAVPGSSYEYRVYLIAQDGLRSEEIVEISRAIRGLLTDPQSHRHFPSGYFRLRAPLLVTPSLWRTGSRWYHALRPVEEQYFLHRHGRVLWGADPRTNLDLPSASDLLRSAAIAVAALKQRVWAALRLRQPARLCDLLVGRIPALWLLLAQRTVATSAPEAVAECAADGFPHRDVLVEVARTVAGCPPRQLPQVGEELWRPALQAVPEWLERLAEMAVAATAEPTARARAS